MTKVLKSIILFVIFNSSINVLLTLIMVCLAIAERKKYHHNYT